jgi:hypothetical protein
MKTMSKVFEEDQMPQSINQSNASYSISVSLSLSLSLSLSIYIYIYPPQKDKNPPSSGHFS